MNRITDNETTTFRYNVSVDGQNVQKEIYDGECSVVYLKPGGEVINPDRQGVRREPVYWRGEISYEFLRTNRTALDRPTVIISIPVGLLGIESQTAAAADFCLRRIAPYFDEINSGYANKARPDGDNGKFIVYKPGSEVLKRNASYFESRPAKDYENGRGAVIYETKYVDPPQDVMCFCVRIEIQLPHGKLDRMRKILTKNLPDAAENFVREFDGEGLRRALSLESKQNEIRKFLRKNNFSAFIANGSVLARDRGTDLPMRGSLPFESAPCDEIEIADVKGMGIKNGVTVITGGGYSGKSTVLNAIAAGIYNHAEGDGRELCVADDSAVTITAEDGRAVSCLNISPFIKWAADNETKSFTTSHASGSTSQAANIIEAVECGASLLLIDEDRSATNFMIRDSLMKRLIKNEPITPFTDRVCELAANGISTILVIGGSGEYLTVADRIYMMDDFKIREATEQAKSLAEEFERNASEPSQIPPADWGVNRSMLSGAFTSYPSGSGSERLEVSDTGFIIVGDERVDVRALHGIATAAQNDAIAFMLRYLMRNLNEGSDLERIASAMRGFDFNANEKPVDAFGLVDALYDKIEKEGIGVVDTGFFVTMNRFADLPRKFELRAAISRMRRLKWKAE